MVALAKPVFEAGPSDAVKTVDVYNIADSTVRNELTSKLSSFGDTLSDIYGKSTETIKGLGSLIKSGAVNLEDAKKRIQGALGGSKADINYLATKLQGTIFSDLTGLSSGTNYVAKANELVSTIGVITTQGTKVFTNTDHNQVSAIMRFVSGLTGNSIFKSLDLGAEAALVKGVLSEVSKWGIPSLVDDILDSTDASVARSAVTRASTNIATSADLATIQSYINKVGASALTAEVPNFAQQLISRYKFPTGTTAEQYPTILAQLVAVMDALQPTWFFTHRSYLSDSTGLTVVEDIANLAILTVASDDATTVLATSEVYAKYVMIAPSYPTKSSRTLLKSMYPYIAIV